MNDSTKKFLAASAVGFTSTFGSTSSAFAQTTTTPSQGITQVEDTVDGLGTISSVAIPIVLTAFGVRLAIKLVNRFAVKG
jgi:hypothetical protein